MINLSNPTAKADLNSITKEEIWAYEAQAEQLCVELAGVHKPLFQRDGYSLVLGVFRIDYGLCTKKGIIKKLTKDDVFELGYYSGIDISVNDANGDLAEDNDRQLTRNITLWGCYKSFFKRRHIMNSASKEELRALIESTLEEYADSLSLEKNAGK